MEANEIILLFVCLCSPQLLKATIVKKEEMEISRERLGKHVPAATNTNSITEKLLYALLYIRSACWGSLKNKRQ
jgi:hypothetical protein